MARHQCGNCRLWFERDSEFPDRVKGEPVCHLCFGWWMSMFGFPGLKAAQEEYEADQARKKNMIRGNTN